MTTSSLPRPAEMTSLPHSGLSVRDFYSMHFMAAMLPLAAGLKLFGWRAALAVVLVCGGTAAGIAVWRRIGSRGKQLSYQHGLWLALLLAMMLPAHLAADSLPGVSDTPWFLLVAAGLILAMVLWVLGGLGSGLTHPVLVTYLLVAALAFDLLTPHFVLQWHRMPWSDLLRSKPPDARFVDREPWTSRWNIPGQDSEMSEPASTALSLYTRGRETPPHPIQSLLRDELPPLEDLIFGGHPSPIGTGSAIAVIFGGLILLYRGLIDYRIPMIIIAVDFAALLILPLPGAQRNQTIWHWFIATQPGVGWGTGITFANYEVMASPVLFMAFFLATSPLIRPMSRRARVIYAFLAGGGSAAMQLYLGVPGAAGDTFTGVAVGPYVALLLASLLTPLLDMWFKARPLV